MKFSYSIVRILLIVFSLLIGLNVNGQTGSKDFTDVVKKWKKDTTASASTELIVRKNYLSVLPVVGYAPANGFLIGGVISLSKLLAPAPTKLSSGMLNFQLTTKKQLIINARSKIYSENNKWFLQGDWRMMFFTQPTYGLGINNSGGNKYLIAVNNLNENDLPLAEPMKFNYLRIYEDAVRKIGSSKWYAGVGVAYDNHFKIVDEKLNTDTASENYFITNHYAYSISKGFDPEEYYTAGFNLDVLTDERDNIANAYKGYYASLSFRINPKFSKSAQTSMLAAYDLRYYLPLSKTQPNKVLAFWTNGTFVIDGNVPYLALPSIGWDTYNRGGRGYIQGRYRGLSMLYTEAEFRFPLRKDGLFGGVLFINNTFAESTTAKLFDKAAPGAGAGFRMKMDKAARVNLTVDLGYGLDHSSGIYFGMQEAF
ncbi:MAG: hypothetical protein ABI723_13345 [Bacteroidia bacterium]